MTGLLKLEGKRKTWGNKTEKNAEILILFFLSDEFPIIAMQTVVC